MKFSSLKDAPELAVSHNALIRKQCLVAPGDIDAISNFSRAVFPPGEVANGHSHEDMTEVFFIESGVGEIEIDGRVVSLAAGACVIVEPGEYHELRNTGADSLVVIYFGVVH